MKEARIYDVEFITSGAVGFPEENAFYYLRDSALEKMAPTMLGKPVYLTHEGSTPIGHVSGIRKKDNGKYETTLSIFSDEANEYLDNGWDFSCAYSVSEANENVNINQINYKYEILDGQYDHIAVVKTPRYNENNFRKLNSAGGKMIGFLKSNSIQKVDIDAEKAFTLISGKKIMIADIVNEYRAKRDHDAHMISHEDTIEIDGKKVKLADVIKALKLNEAKETKEEVIEKKSQNVTREAEEETKETLDSEEEIVRASEAVIKSNSYKVFRERKPEIISNSKPKVSYTGLKARESIGKTNY